MEKKVRYIFLLTAFLSVQMLVFGQYTLQHPPEPTMANETEDGIRRPCGEVPEGEENTGPGIPPPVGLCLPINDYLFPLFISGIVLGAFSLFHLQQKREAKNSIV